MNLEGTKALDGLENDSDLYTGYAEAMRWVCGVHWTVSSSERLLPGALRRVVACGHAAAIGRGGKSRSPFDELKPVGSVLTRDFLQLRAGIAAGLKFWAVCSLEAWCGARFSGREAAMC